MSEQIPIDPNWEELEKDPQFIEELVMALGVILEVKKFGDTFLSTHDNMAYRKLLENEEGQVQENAPFGQKLEALLNSENNPLLPEIGNFRKEKSKAKTVDDLFRLAKKHDIEITSEDMSEARGCALEGYLDK
jgi:hypothetical protein